MNKQNQEPRDENGLPHGEWLLYRPSGELMYRQNYVHGVAHGLWESYHDNGGLFWCGNMINNKRDGIFKQYCHDGILRIKQYFFTDISSLYVSKHDRRLSLNL